MKKIIVTILKIILGLLVAAAAVIGILIAVYMPRNVEAMNRGVQAALDEISAHATVTEADTGEYGNLRLYGIMQFKIHRYEVEDVGNLTTMTMNMGLMQMSTVILTPLDKDIPLISTDYIYVLGNRTSYLECYDLVLDKGNDYESFLEKLREIKASVADLDTITPTSAWYDSMRTVGVYMKGKRADDEREEEALVQWIRAAMDYADSKDVLNTEEKAQKLPVVEEYTNGLVDQGGVSTDIFVRALGEEKTRDFFEKVLFGTQGAEER